MNDYINAQVQQMRVYTQAWEATCIQAAKKTDGIIDKEEEKALKQIHKAVERFTKDLTKI